MNPQSLPRPNTLVRNPRKTRTRRRKNPVTRIRGGTKMARRVTGKVAVGVKTAAGPGTTASPRNAGSPRREASPKREENPEGTPRKGENPKIEASPKTEANPETERSPRSVRKTGESRKTRESPKRIRKPRNRPPKPKTHTSPSDGVPSKSSTEGWTIILTLIIYTVHKNFRCSLYQV